MATVISQLIALKNIRIQATPIGWIKGISIIFSYFYTIFNIDNDVTHFTFLVMVMMYDVVLPIMERHEGSLISTPEILFLLIAS